MRLNDIISFINSELGIDIRLKKKTNEYVFARTLFYKLALDLTHYSLDEIGKSVNKDHCAVLHNVKNFDYAYQRPEIKRIYNLYKNIPEDENILDVSSLQEKNNDLRKEIMELNVKLERLERGAEGINAMIADLTEEQLDKVILRLQPMIKLIKSERHSKPRETKELKGALL